jgi:diguanylate cyclase (GGDEF)-like protein
MMNLTKSIIAQALDTCPAPTVIVDVRSDPWKIAYVNAEMETLTNRDAAALAGLAWQEFVRVSQETMGELDEVLCGESHKICVELVDSEDQPISMDLSVVPLYDRPGQIAFWAGTRTQTGAEHRRGEADEGQALREALHDARTRLRRLEKTDSATGVLVARAFEELYQRDWAIARREQRRLSLIVFEVDALERYREVFGRQSADACLRKVAHAVSGSLRRAGDLVGRLGDDRLAVLVGDADESAAIEFANRIADKVQRLSIHHPRSPFGRFVSISFGVASEVPDWNAQASALLDNAAANVGQQRPASDQRVV